MKRILPFIFLLALCYFAVKPLLSTGYFPMHDDTQVSRVIEMGKALKDGQFPVRWVSDLGYGYGYPIFNFYGPLPYYVGGALYAIGMPALEATKIMFAMGITFPALCMFLVMSAAAGWEAGLLSSVLYLFSPYHAVQVYVRGAVGEYWELLFWPLIYFSFSRWETHKKNGIPFVLGALGIGGAVLAHTLFGYVTVLSVGIWYVLYWLVRLLQRRFDVHAFAWQGACIFLGLGLSAFFWIPAAAEMSFTSVSGQVSATANYLDHFVCFSQLWTSVWGYGGSAAGCLDGQSYMLGKIHILLASASVLAWVFFRRKDNKTALLAGFVFSAIGIFFATPLSSVLWKYIPGFPYLQYPWRFLSVAGFGLALLGGLLPRVVPNGIMRVGGAVCFSVLVVSMSAKWFVPQYLYEKSSSAFEDVLDLQWRASKISDEYLPPAIIRPTEATNVVFDTIYSGDAFVVSAVEQSSILERLVVTATSSAVVKLRKAYFPGWRYYVNDQEVKPVVQNGLPSVEIFKGNSEIVAVLTDTPVRMWSNIVSFISVTMVIFIYYGKQKNTKC